jgi:phosphopantetheinyl transferase (holo-ACP synthase)
MKLSIVRLDHSRADFRAKTIPHDLIIGSLTREVLDYLSCKPALEAARDNNQRWSSLGTKPSLKEFLLKQTLVKNVMRYVRDPDRWIAFTSLLLKSIAFYRYVESSMSIPVDEETKLPVVDLPRTKLNRPYLPRIMTDKACARRIEEVVGEEVEESTGSMMNISHQYPYACMIQKQDESSFPLIGCDVVIFDAHLNKHTPTISEFLKVFVGSFTPLEWQSISTSKNALPRSDDDTLQEFYLRWAMKEAHTKALGYGMNVDFDSFETRLIGLDVDGVDQKSAFKPHDGIWKSIKAGMNMSSNQHDVQVHHQVSFVSQITRKRKQNVAILEGDFWVFTFIPLVERSELAGKKTIESENTTTRNGCVVVCRGPFHDIEDATTSSNEHHIVLENLTLMDLIRFHGMKAVMQKYK